MANSHSPNQTPKPTHYRLLKMIKNPVFLMCFTLCVALAILFQNCGQQGSDEKPRITGTPSETETSTPTPTEGTDTPTPTASTTETPIPSIPPTNTGEITVPDSISEVQELATEHATELAQSCDSWDFIDQVVTALQAIDERFGYKCRHDNCREEISKHEVAYYLGADSSTLTTDADFSQNISVIEVVQVDCSDDSPSPKTIWTEIEERGRWRQLRTPWILDGKCNNESRNQCKPGTPVNQGEDNQNYTWDCEGFNGGATATGCQISKQAQVNGQCSQDKVNDIIRIKNKCSRGEPANTGTSDDETHYHLWTCRGVNDGTDDQCKKPNNWCDNSVANGCKTGTTAVEKKMSANYMEWKCRHDTDNITSLAQCSKRRTVACGTKNSCATGTPDKDAIDDTFAEYRWQCTYNSRTIGCHECKSYARPQNGQCADSAPHLCKGVNVLVVVDKPTLTPPRTGFLAKDLVHNPNGKATWKCRGLYGGTDDSCERTPKCATDSKYLCKDSLPINFSKKSDNSGIEWQCRATYTSTPIKCERDGDPNTLIGALTTSVAGICSINCMGEDLRCAAGNGTRPSGIPSGSWVCKGINGGVDSSPCHTTRAWGGSPSFNSSDVNGNVVGSCPNIPDLLDFSRCPRP